MHSPIKNASKRGRKRKPKDAEDKNVTCTALCELVATSLAGDWSEDLCNISKRQKAYCSQERNLRLRHPQNQRLHLLCYMHGSSLFSTNATNKQSPHKKVCNKCGASFATREEKSIHCKAVAQHLILKCPEIWQSRLHMKQKDVFMLCCFQSVFLSVIALSGSFGV